MSYKNEFKNCLDGLFESLCDVSDWMYENPELGFEEFKTSKYLVDYIQKNSKSVNYPLMVLKLLLILHLVKRALLQLYVLNMMPCLKLAMHVDTTLLQQHL